MNSFSYFVFDSLTGMHSVKTEKYVSLQNVKLKRRLNILAVSALFSKLFSNLKLSNSNRAKAAELLTLCVRFPTCYNVLPSIISSEFSDAFTVLV